MRRTTYRLYLPRWLFLAVAISLLPGGLGLVGMAAGASNPPYPRNIIILLAAGVAAPQFELAESTSAHFRHRPTTITGTFLKEGVVGLMTTDALEAIVTDSAAAGSAMSTGVKTTNGTIAMTPDGRIVRTAMEAAKAQGKHIGLVTTAAVYDATPAAFSVHARSRQESQVLVDQYLALEPDVLLGGGRDFFLPAGPSGGKRNDGKDMLTAFRAKGYQVVRNAQELRTATGSKLLGLFADRDMRHEIDRDSAREPSLADMAQAALRVLAHESPHGFVLLLESENTDTAGHRNDMAALIGDLWIFDRTVQLAREFQRQTFAETLLVVTGDHETGGLTLAKTSHDLSRTLGRDSLRASSAYWEMLDRIGRSIEWAVATLGKPPAAEVLQKASAERFPGLHLQADRRAAFLKQQLMAQQFNVPHPSTLVPGAPSQLEFSWTTAGHTPKPVTVGALGPRAELFRGILDNTDFGKILHRLIEGQ